MPNSVVTWALKKNLRFSMDCGELMRFLIGKTDTSKKYLRWTRVNRTPWSWESHRDFSVTPWRFILRPAIGIAALGSKMYIVRIDWYGTLELRKHHATAFLDVFSFRVYSEFWPIHQFYTPKAASIFAKIIHLYNVIPKILCWLLNSKQFSISTA